LEDRLGKALYLEVISTDYCDWDALDHIKQLLTSYASQAPQPSCMCVRISDLAVVDMGFDGDKVFRSLAEIKRRGPPYWWLSADRCGECGQAWLVASEERQNDVLCMKRLSADAMDQIINRGDWPSMFDRYDTLLRMGLRAGKSVRFVDPLNSSLRWTVADLAKETPGIRVSKLMTLLNLDYETAAELALRAVLEEGANIDFEQGAF
jgi:hypothetical protein